MAARQREGRYSLNETNRRVVLQKWLLSTRVNVLMRTDQDPTLID